MDYTKASFEYGSAIAYDLKMKNKKSKQRLEQAKVNFELAKKEVKHGN